MYDDYAHHPTAIRETLDEPDDPAAALISISPRTGAIRAMAADHGLIALEGLADYGAHHAMLPGYREATRACLSHMDEALGSDHGGDLSELGGRDVRGIVRGHDGIQLS